MSSTICKECGSEFPNRIEIDGEIKNIYHRDVCTSCKPHRSQNPDRHPDKSEGDEMVCELCGREYIYDRSKGHRKGKCNSCLVSDRRRKKKKELVELFGGECEKCGFSECHRALNFHHRNKDEKEFGITSCVGTRNWESVVNEAKKCDLLCANCHMIEHCKYCN